MCNIKQLCYLMSVETLSTTLEQLHVTVRNLPAGTNRVSKQSVLPKMVNFHSFTFAQSMFSRIMEFNGQTFIFVRDRY